MNTNWVYLGAIITGIVAFVSLVFACGNWYGRVNSDRKSFKDFMAEVRDDIKEILKRLPPVVTTKSSPIRLTELGKSISNELEALTWAKQTATLLQNRVVGKHPYEIQNFCFDYVAKESVLPEGMNEKIKSCAYENGITTEQVLEVLAVELRDELLERMWK